MIEVSEDFLEKIDILFFKLDVQGKYIYLNKVCKDIFGWPKEEMIGRDFRDYVSEDDSSKCRPFFEDVTKNGRKQYRLEIEIKTESDEKKILGFSLYPDDKEGKIIGMLGVGTDITELKHLQERARETLAEKARLEEAEKSAAYFNAMGEVLIVTTLDTKIIKINKVFSQLWGYLPEEVIGKSVLELFPEEEVPKHKAEMQKVVETGTIRKLETIALTKDRKKIPVDLTSTVMKNGQGRSVGFIGVIRDISEMRKAKEEIEKKFKDLERFHKVTVGREMEMVKLKEEINSLLEKLDQPKKYEAPEKIKRKR